MNEVATKNIQPTSLADAADAFARTVLHWFDQHGRHDLPWQHPRTAYRVWLAEIMLQQTQVQTVRPYFETFVQRFPDLRTLAAASQDEVMRYWSGLGYYARARNLHKTAVMICTEHGGEFPREFEQVHALPGIGRSTAGAILAQAFGQRHAILDGNVKRVLARYHGIDGWPGAREVEAQLWQQAEAHTPTERLADYTQAMMDLGATLCTRSRPACAQCPLHAGCVARQQQRTAQLPGARPRKTLPVKAARLLLVQNEQGEVLLQKRPPTGIWGGLWSLPECTLDDDVAELCQRHWRVRVTQVQDEAVLRHTFSHYHFDITPCRVRINNPGHCVMEDPGLLWYNSAHSELPGLPAPVKLILNRYLQED